MAWSRDASWRRILSACAATPLQVAYGEAPSEVPMRRGLRPRRGPGPVASENIRDPVGQGLGEMFAGAKRLLRDQGDSVPFELGVLGSFDQSGEQVGAQFPDRRGIEVFEGFRRRRQLVVDIVLADEFDHLFECRIIHRAVPRSRPIVS